MNKSKVSVVRYEAPVESVRKAVDLCHGLDSLPTGPVKVFVKPNIVFWARNVDFPKWGVLTTSRVVHDVVMLLKERGVQDITIGEGSVTYDAKHTEPSPQAFEGLGYANLVKRYGVKLINVFDRPFEKVDLGDGITLNFNSDFVNSDFVVSLPVMKTHAQTVVSLGIKNFKGLIDVNSRRKCHSADPEKNLDFMISKLADRLPPSLTLLDGIFTNERGPSFDGRIRRNNILVASRDIFEADKVGARLLGYDPSEVPHLAHALKRAGKAFDLSAVEVIGEKIEDLTMKLEYSFAYNEAGSLPIPFEKMGIKGLSYPKYDGSLCTGCSVLTSVLLLAIAGAWRGEPWDDVEVLTGKFMKPTPGMKKTLLLGKCMYSAHKDNPDIKQAIAVKGCPPNLDEVVNAVHELGIAIDGELIKNVDASPAVFLSRYKGKPEFDASLFRIDD
jgi:uncharacterized protein (DUF362 family)